MSRTDSDSRIILAPPHRIWQALTDPAAVVRWRPPDGMRAEVHAFDAREGGTFRLTLIHTARGSGPRGKSSEHADVVRGRFLELVPDTRMVELVEFESDDPLFAGAMTITTTLAPLEDGTEVTIRCDGVPPGIRPADHAAGIASTLAKLATLTEGTGG